MARASTVTKVDLDQFAEIIGYNPAPFNQVSDKGAYRFKRESLPTLYQYARINHQQPNREMIARDLLDAERAFEMALCWHIRPTFVTDTIYNPVLSKRIASLPAETHQDMPLSLGYSKLIQGGVETFTAIETDVAITTSDEDNDGFNETWTCVLSSVTITDTSEIEVYFTSTDRFPSGAPIEQQWRIHDVKFKLDGTTLTITGKRLSLVKPALTESVDSSEVQALEFVDSTFVTTVDVYRRYCDNTQPHVTFEYLNAKPQTGYMVIANNSQVLVYPGTYDTTNGWTASEIRNERPLKVTIRYLAGHPTDAHGRTDNYLAQLVSYFASGMPTCKQLGATGTEHYGKYVDPKEAIPTFNQELFNSNTFGTWLGAFRAWEFVYRELSQSI